MKYKSIIRAYFKDNLPNKIKDGAYVTNLDEYSDIGSHCIALYAFNNNATYFDSFGVEHILKEKIRTNKYFQNTSSNLVICGYFCTGFVNFMLKNKSLTDSTNLFSPNDLKKIKNKKNKNDDINLDHFKNV